MWKINNSPIMVQTDKGLRWMGLCQNFNYCCNFLLRDVNRWRSTNRLKRPICSRCVLDKKKQRVHDRYWRLKAIREAKEKGLPPPPPKPKPNSFFDEECRQAKQALDRGLFSAEDYDKEIAYLKEKYKRE